MSAACPQQPPKKKRKKENVVCWSTFHSFGRHGFTNITLNVYSEHRGLRCFDCFFFLKRKGKNCPVVGFGHVEDDILRGEIQFGARMRWEGFDRRRRLPFHWQQWGLVHRHLVNVSSHFALRSFIMSVLQSSRRRLKSAPLNRFFFPPVINVWGCSFLDAFVHNNEQFGWW